MTINGIVAEVENTVFIPFDIHWIERPVGDLRRRRYPINALGLLGPKGVRIGNALRIHPVIIGGTTLRVCRGVCGYREPVLMFSHLLSPITQRLLSPCISGVGHGIQG